VYGMYVQYVHIMYVTVCYVHTIHTVTVFTIYIKLHWIQYSNHAHVSYIVIKLYYSVTKGINVVLYHTNTEFISFKSKLLRG
jgi:hypothetical protein